MRAARTAAVLALLAAGPARAEVFTIFGFNPRSTAMAGALTAEANDYTATFYNPALLVNRTDVNFGFSFNWWRPITEVTPKDPARTLDCTYCRPPDALGWSLGFLFPLGGVVKNRVALGVGLYVPIERLLRLMAADPDQPMWYHFTNHQERLVLYLGAGIRIVDWLTIGLGIQLLADLVGQGAKVKVDLFSKRVESQSLDSHLATHAAPVFGLQVRPHPRVRIGATFRYEMSLTYEIPATVDLEGIGTLAFVATGLAHYSPHTIAFGVAVDVHPDVTLALDGEVSLWSLAPTPYTSLKIDLSGETLDALGLGTALDITYEPGTPGFADTFGGRLGAEYRISQRVAARLGAFLRPTPVPRQNSARTNILDATTVGVTAGAGFNFDDPLEVFKSPIHIDLATQAQFMLQREAQKDLSDDVPSYSYSGRLFGVSAAVRYDF